MGMLVLALAKRCGFLTGERLELGGEVFDVGGIWRLGEDLVDHGQEVVFLRLPTRAYIVTLDAPSARMMIRLSLASMKSAVPGERLQLAAFLGVSAPVAITMLGVGAATNRDGLIAMSFIAAPLGRTRPSLSLGEGARPAAGQASRYQAVYASRIDMDFAGIPRGFTLPFENDAYARRFVDLNRDAGVADRSRRATGGG